MTAPARFKQSDINRAMRGARAAGFTDVRIEIATDGKLVVHGSVKATDLPADDWRANQPLYRDH